MQRHDALKALDIYRRAGQQVLNTDYFLNVVGVYELICPPYFLLNSISVLQAESLSEFYEVFKNLDVGRGERFIKIEQV